MTATTDTTAKKVLQIPIPIVSTMQSIQSVLHELRGFLDKESLKLLEQLHLKGIFHESTRGIRQIELIELEKDVFFVEIPQIMQEKGLMIAHASSCLDLLYALRGKRNADIRRAFFEGGLTLLSMEMILIDGMAQYLIIGQNHVLPRNDEQKVFSIRTLTPSRMFAHKLYRIIGARR